MKLLEIMTVDTLKSLRKQVAGKMCVIDAHHGYKIYMTEDKNEAIKRAIEDIKDMEQDITPENIYIYLFLKDDQPYPRCFICGEEIINSILLSEHFDTHTIDEISYDIIEKFVKEKFGVELIDFSDKLTSLVVLCFLKLMNNLSSDEFDSTRKKIVEKVFIVKDRLYPYKGKAYLTDNITEAIELAINDKKLTTAWNVSGSYQYKSYRRDRKICFICKEDIKKCNSIHTIDQIPREAIEWYVNNMCRHVTVNFE